MPLTLYFHPVSQPSRSVLAFLKLTGIPYEIKVIDIMRGETRGPEYAKINPAMTVPAIDDDGFILGESEAIVRYLMNSRKVGEELYPSDPKIRAQVDKYFPFHHNTVRPQFSKCFMATYIDLLPPEYADYGLKKYQEDAGNCLKQFEEFYLKDQKYIAGDVLTIADIFLLSELTLAAFHTDFSFADYPKTKAYMERCLENKVLKEVSDMTNELPKIAKELREEMKSQGAAPPQENK